MSPSTSETTPTVPVVTAVGADATAHCDTVHVVDVAPRPALKLTLAPPEKVLIKIRPVVQAPVAVEVLPEEEDLESEVELEGSDEEFDAGAIESMDMDDVWTPHQSKHKRKKATQTTGAKKPKVTAAAPPAAKPKKGPCM